MLDAREVLLRNASSPEHSQRPTVNMVASAERLHAWWQTHAAHDAASKPARLVITGFVCRDSFGLISTLGRNGSDYSASDAVAGQYQNWLAAGIHVITPNKQAGSGDLDRYQQLQQSCQQGKARWRYEATVGAGLPVIQTLRDLIDSGDRIIRIEGLLSGTLAWLFNRFQTGVAFSDLIREARSAGYTEPDPRDDLSGMDVARKLVIMAREMDMNISLQQVDVEALVSDDMLHASVDEFMANSVQLDAPMDARLQQAAAKQQKLRYLARLECDQQQPAAISASVSLQAVDRAHPFAHLALTDNVIAFTSERYHDNSLIIRGPGAGPEVTAAGVFADLLRIAQGLGAAI